VIISRQNFGGHIQWNTPPLVSRSDSGSHVSSYWSRVFRFYRRIFKRWHFFNDSCVLCPKANRLYTSPTIQLCQWRVTYIRTYSEARAVSAVPKFINKCRAKVICVYCQLTQANHNRKLWSFYGPGLLPIIIIHSE
jgi:hypothetical protein